MPDPVSALNLALGFIPAAAGLGTAAMGMVDSSKVLPGGGPSQFGFGFIEEALTPFLKTDEPPDAGPAKVLDGKKPVVPPGPELPSTPTSSPAPPQGAFGQKQLIRTLKSNWINGVDTAEQKAAAKSLIHMMLTKDNAETFATAAGVDKDLLKSLAVKVASGAQPEREEVTVLGQFDVVLSAILDDAYERGDQRYRNGCKSLAMLVAIILSVLSARLIGSGPLTFHSFGTAFLVGLCATPLAPIAKDLATSLQSAASALGFVKG